MPFRNRQEAGRILAGELAAYAGRPDVIVLALPRGGVPVGFEVAQALDVPLDVFLVRKLGVPGQEELAMGAIASGGMQVPNISVLRQLGIPAATFAAVAARERTELARRERAYRDDRPAPDLADRTVILVDDGLATGTTMRAAATAVRAQRPARIIAAVPVGAAETCAELQNEVDELICLAAPEQFYAVGLWYDDFAPTTDAEVRDLLAEAARRHPLASIPPSGSSDAPLPQGQD